MCSVVFGVVDLEKKICGVMGQGSLGCTADDDLNTMLPKFLLLFPK